MLDADAAATPLRAYRSGGADGCGHRRQGPGPNWRVFHTSQNSVPGSHAYNAGDA